MGDYGVPKTRSQPQQHVKYGRFVEYVWLENVMVDNYNNFTFL